MRDILITVEELHEALAAPHPPRILDVRWALGSTSGRAEHAAGHIPGAVYVDLDEELAAPPSPAHGRHPLPSVRQLQAAARGWGLDEGDEVVVYDGNANLVAARAWWLLRDAEVSCRMLDGALPAWVAAGYPLETGEAHRRPGTITLRLGSSLRLCIDDAAELPADGVLLDARAAPRYRGEVEPIDPRPGHIPGAVSAPTTANVDATGRFLPAEDLRARFAALGVRDGRPVGVYCGSGVNASHELAALAIAGFDGALFPGSWSEWSNDPDRPTASGPTP